MIVAYTALYFIISLLWTIVTIYVITIITCYPSKFKKDANILFVLNVIIPVWELYHHMQPYVSHPINFN